MRKAYLDNIRWITVVLVVIYHVFYMYNGEGIPGVLGKITDLPVQYWDLYQYAVYPWFMSILFIVSGICARYDLMKHSGKEFIRKRTTRFLVPSTIGLFAFQFIQGYINMSLGGAFETMTASVPLPAKFLIMAVSGTGVLWYIQMLWLFSLLLLLVRRIEKDRLWKIGEKVNAITLMLLTVPVWGAAQILNTPIIAVYRFGFYAAMFFLGYFVFSHEEVIDRTKRFFPLSLIIAAAAGLAFCLRYFGENYAIEPVNRTPLFVIYGWFACFAILGGMAKYGDFENRFTGWINRHSFGLYVFHYLGISAVALWVAKPRLLPAPVVYMLSLIAGFVLSYLLNAIISRLPFFRWAVLGLSHWGRF